jgi:hypothetical protein
MKRSELRKLILEELNNVSEAGFFSKPSFSGGNHGDHALTTGQVMDQMRGADVEDEINDAMEKEMSTGYGLRDVRDARPLDTVELVALMMADKDENSDYKLSRDRLAILSYGNLTAEELEIVNK